MNESVKGAIGEAAGKVQDAVGEAVGDAGMQAEGTLREAAGKAQRTYGEVLDDVRGAVSDNPMIAVALVAGVSFVLGALWARRD
jgi:uncharacterized protein YjbJ (UPF0337 family)